ncbi:hypothetical protein [Halomonas garicola]|uniref:hypothetical protein n=1 Tax=Halomonas garicola TaxID=1690008 RepID=UPI002898EC03|nr:hypothetical protein [Halomonas garicola]
MLWHLIAAVVSGLAAAGIGLFLRTLSGKRLPKWIVPVCAGLGMLGYQINAEYRWFEHKQQQLPESAVVISKETGSAVWRPWTFIFPMVDAFSVVDRDNIHHGAREETPVTELIVYHFERHYADVVTPTPYLINCDTRELVPLDDDSGKPAMNELRTLRDSAPLYITACRPPREV